MTEAKTSQEQFLAELVQRRAVVTAKIKELNEVLIAIERLERLERSVAQSDLFPSPGVITTVSAEDLSTLGRTEALIKVLSESPQSWFRVSLIMEIFEKRGFKSDSETPAANLIGEALNRLVKRGQVERTKKVGRLHYRWRTKESSHAT